MKAFGFIKDGHIQHSGSFKHGSYPFIKSLHLTNTNTSIDNEIINAYSRLKIVGESVCIDRSKFQKPLERISQVNKLQFDASLESAIATKGVFNKLSDTRTEQVYHTFFVLFVYKNLVRSCVLARKYVRATKKFVP